MVRQTEGAEHFRQSKAGGGLRIALTLLGGPALIGGICLLIGRWSGQPLERRIAAVNAHYALAPEANAATRYDQLAADNVLTGDPADPQLAPAALAALIEASNIESCWLPLSPGEGCYRDHAYRTRAMREWARALVSAARKDITQGQVDAAAEKLGCVLRMGDHLRQQGLMIDFGIGYDLEARVWSCLRDFIMQSHAATALLTMAETLPVGLVDNRKQAFARIDEAQPLIAASVLDEWSLRQRVRNWWRQLGSVKHDEILREWYLRSLSLRRGVRVLGGLRRYHDANGRWPESLEEIRSLVPEQAVIDPYTGQLPVYKRTGDGFRLYTRGANKIDENGAGGPRVRGSPDDFLIWPSYSPVSAQTQASK